MRARVLHGAVLAALATTALAWVSLDKSVTLEIDGEARVVMTHASTVGEVLDRAGIRVDAHDLLAPSSSSRVKDGSRVIIKRGRLVTVRVNNVERGVWVNSADVDQVLDEIGVEADERTYVSASRSSRVPSTGTFALHVRMPSEVHLVFEGSSRIITTTAATVADLLVEEGVTLTSHQYTSVPLYSYPAEGMTIIVADRRGVRVSRTRPIPFKAVTKVDPKLPAGTTRVLTPGVPGVLVAYFRESVTPVGTVRVPDGTRVAREPLDQVVLVSSVAAPVAGLPAAPKPVAAKQSAPVVTKPVAPKPVATKPAPKPPLRTAPIGTNKPAADKLNWYALAMCESGNNPRALSRGGTYRGLYQFLMSTWRGVGGVGDPINASRDEQTYRAQILYKRTGSRSWGACGSRLYS